MPLPDKVEAIKNIAVPASKKKLRRVLGLIHCINICGNIETKY